ncbi:MAG TPA: hypothetical protein VN155_17040 [Devosia sp.]|nr:hypothetical protein [Devosia sp.]
MNLIPNWRVVISHAWSIRLMLLAAVLSGLEVALPFMPSFVTIPDRTFAVLSALTVAAAFIARLLAQKQITAPDPLEQHYEDM